MLVKFAYMILSHTLRGVAALAHFKTETIKAPVGCIKPLLLIARRASPQKDLSSDSLKTEILSISNLKLYLPIGKVDKLKFLTFVVATFSHVQLVISAGLCLLPIPALSVAG